MGKALETVNKFYDATNTRKSIKETAGLIADDLTFTGPVIRQDARAHGEEESLKRYADAHENKKL